MSTIVDNRSKVALPNQINMITTTNIEDISAERDQHTILNGMGSPKIGKKEFQLGSLSPTSDHNHSGIMMMD